MVGNEKMQSSSFLIITQNAQKDIYIYIYIYIPRITSMYSYISFPYGEISYITVWNICCQIIANGDFYLTYNIKSTGMGYIVYSKWFYVLLLSNVSYKPVYNDHLIRHFSAFWSSSRWGHLDELQEADIVSKSKLVPSVSIKTHY